MQQKNSLTKWFSRCYLFLFTSFWRDESTLNNIWIALILSWSFTFSRKRNKPPSVSLDIRNSSVKEKISIVKGSGLDSPPFFHRPPELASKYSNFSEGVCKPGYASALMTSIFPKFSKPAPMFLDDSFKKWARIRDFVPPFGIKGQDNLIKAILSATKVYRLTPALDSLSCRRCVIVGNGGVLANKSLGLKIDDYDVVIRLNSAPVKGFEKDVGGKTTLRITYPEGAIQKLEQYEKDSFFVLAGFKWQDFKWLKYIVYKEKVSASDGFWKSVATRVPREPHEIRILNPYFIQEAAFSFIGLPFNNGLMGRGNIPTLGSVAITMALHNCDEVAVAGFGYDMQSPNAPLHYYETIKMSAIKESWTHNIQREKEFLRKLVKAHVITDLTSGI
uniref:CMP-N-acetylneuraminate-beta-1,4-galactoside alpha-2,3-sialyltransferase n=1 Tax=Pelusios castaneus TaxID=367368 RepID=A0A8C8VK38_9SAUR